MKQIKLIVAAVGVGLILFFSTLAVFGPNNDLTPAEQEFYELTCMEMTTHPDADVLIVIELKEGGEPDVIITGSLNRQAKDLVKVGDANNIEEGREKVLEFYGEWLKQTLNNEAVKSVFVKCILEE